MMNNLLLFNKVISCITPYVLIKQNNKIFFSNIPGDIDLSLEEVNYNGKSYIKNTSSFMDGDDEYTVFSYMDISFLKDKIYTDSKTKILSHGSITSILGEKIARRKKFVFGLVAVNEIDIFRQRYGDKIADELLISVARKIKKFIKEEDLVGRFTNDVFIVAIKGTDLKSIKEKAEEGLIELQKDYEYKGVSSLPISLSLGFKDYDYRKTYIQNFKETEDLVIASRKLGDNRVLVSTDIIDSQHFGDNSKDHEDNTDVISQYKPKEKHL